MIPLDRFKRRDNVAGTNSFGPPRATEDAPGTFEQQDVQALP